MPLKTKRWNDPRRKDDGYRLLICRYRPRGVAKEDETWHSWCTELAPSKGLHADCYGKNGPAITWEEYRRRFLEEMQADEPRGYIEELTEMVAEGKTITLLCSSACTDENRCHRMLLRQLIEERLANRSPSPALGEPGA